MYDLSKPIECIIYSSLDYEKKLLVFYSFFKNLLTLEAVSNIISEQVDKIIFHILFSRHSEGSLVET